MSKVKRITVSNLKAVSKMTADFNGCTAIITGGNNKGKTSFLRSEFDRMKGIKPELILKVGETEGFSEIELTTGDKFRWEFSNKAEKGFKEKMTYVTDKDIRSSITTTLRDRFFPATFDVDRFLQDTPKKQRETLQKLVGLDFTEVDANYKTAYEDREAKNRFANEKRILLAGMAVAIQIDPVELTALQAEKATERERLDKLYEQNRNTNSEARRLWQDRCDDIRKNIEDFNGLQNALTANYNKCVAAYTELLSGGYVGSEVGQFIADLKDSIQELKVFEPPPEPTYIPELPDQTELNLIDQSIVDAVETNRKAKLWEDYQTAVKVKDAARVAAGNAQRDVETAEKARMDLIKSAKMPEGFGFGEDSIAYNELPFTREQLSSSGIYIAALKLAAMTLGEVKTLHFDASFLDKNSLADIEKWANNEELQLLIERPDFEGGEIEYQLCSL